MAPGIRASRKVETLLLIRPITGLNQGAENGKRNKAETPTASYKAKVALSAIAGDKTLAKLA